MQKKVIEAGKPEKVTDYLSGYQYVDGKLEFYPHSEGYVKVNEDSSINYVYNYTDHLGNVRVSYTDSDKNGIVEIVEESNYYPFGLKHKGYNNVTSKNPNYKYGYNGKELNDELELNTLDFGTRFLDPATGRWYNVDPLAEDFPNWSPYAYVLNNPLVYTDPTGMSPDTIFKNKETGETVEVNDGVNVTLEVSNKQYQRAVMFSDKMNPKGNGEVVDLNDVVEANNEYLDFYDKALWDQSASRFGWGNLAYYKTVGSPKLLTQTYVGGTVPDIGGGKKAASKTLKEISKPSISQIKKALKEVHKLVGGSLKKMEKGSAMKSTPRRGTPKRGYRLDPPHVGGNHGEGKDKPYWHIDWHTGKRKAGKRGTVKIDTKK